MNVLIVALDAVPVEVADADVLVVAPGQRRFVVVTDVGEADAERREHRST